MSKLETQALGEPAAALFRAWYNLRPRLVGESLLGGAAAAVLVIAFRLVLDETGRWRLLFLAWARSRSGGWAPAVLILGGMAALAGWITRWAPEAAGSGVPHVEAVLLEQRRLVWWRLIPVKFVASILAISGGLSLGREGPSVQLGAAGGQAVGRLLRRPYVEERYLITCGAGAGLAAAFNAPLTGLVFVLEELRRNLSPYVFLSALTASVAAGIVTQHLLGLGPLLPLELNKPLPPQALAVFVVLGAATGLLGVAFNAALNLSLDLYGRLRSVPHWLHPGLAAVVGALIGYYFTPAVLGGGHALIERVLTETDGVTFLVWLLLTKFVLTILSCGSGVPGGLYLPLLSIGALTGSILGRLATPFFPDLTGLTAALAVAGMAATFTSVVRAPLTGIVLVLELTASSSNLFFLLAGCLTAYLVAEGLKCLPMAEVFLERDRAGALDPCTKHAARGMTLVEVTVESGSTLDRHLVREVEVPEDCLMLAIRRGSQELVPRGNTKIRAGDQVTFLLPRERAVEVMPQIRSLALCRMASSE